MQPVEEKVPADSQSSAGKTKDCENDQTEEGLDDKVKSNLILK